MYCWQIQMMSGHCYTIVAELDEDALEEARKRNRSQAGGDNCRVRSMTLLATVDAVVPWKK